MVACKEDDKTMEMVEMMRDWSAFLLVYVIIVLMWGRFVIDGYIEYAFKPWEEKIIRKHMNWKEWLLYSRFRSVVPKTLLYPYYFFLGVWALEGFACLYIFLFTAEQSSDVIYDIVFVTASVHIIYLIALDFLLPPVDGVRLDYKRWYKRPRDEVRREIRLKYMEKREDLLEENQEQVQQKGRKKTTGNRRKTGTRRKGKREGNKKKK